MATSAFTATPALTADEAVGTAPSYTPALTSLTVLFFMMGFITWLNDILVPFLKAIFGLTYTQANLINLCFFGAYFIMGVPAGRRVLRIGYQRGMQVGFLVEASGLLKVAIVGGALVPLLFGRVADVSSLRWALVLPVLCYAYIVWYGLAGNAARPIDQRSQD